MRKTIISRINKLFALADPSSNNHEGEILNALTLAKELMEEHQITEYELHQHAGEETPRWIFTKANLDLGNRSRLFYWELCLINAVQNLTNTRCVQHTGTNLYNGKRSITATFYGDEVDCQLALYLYSYLANSGNLLAKPLRGKTLKFSYLVGFSVAVFERSKPTPTSLTLTDQQNKYALVSTEKRDWLTNKLREEAPNLQSNKRSTRVNSGAYESGYADGKNQSLRGDNTLTETGRKALR